jgi:hypothetical protein
VFIADFNKATSFQLDNIKPNKTDSTLAHLVDFNITPSFIPEGNAEALIKSACVGMRKLDMEVEKITQSAFYTFVIREKEEINSTTLFQAIKHIEAKIELDIEGKEKFVKLTKTLTDNGKYKNAFLLFSYFYYLKKVIEKNDYDVSVPKDDILELKYYDSDIASMVLLMLGYTFSIQTISKSIQSFSKSELLKNPKNLDLEWTPRIAEQKVVEELELDKKYKNLKEIEKTSNHNQSNSGLDDDKAIEIELSFEIKQDIEPKINDEPALDLFSSKKETAGEVIISLFTFQEFEINLKKRKSFLPKILKELRAIGIKENEITEPILIKCLKDIGEYKMQNGRLKVRAKEALQIFE